MTMRMVVLGAAVSALVACGPARPTSGSGGGEGGGGFIGTGGSTGTGGSGGSGGSGGNGGGEGTGGQGGAGGGSSTFGWDGGTTVSGVKGARFCQEQVTLENVVVTAIENIVQGSQGDWQAQFWVADQNDPESAIYVDKYYTDPPGPYRVQVGDVLTLRGYLKRQSEYNDRRAYRLTFGSQFGCGSTLTGKLEVLAADGGGFVEPLEVTQPFGDAQGGNARPNSRLGSALVTIPGPLVLTDPSPMAFSRISERTNDTTYFGFEVTGGILVNNYATYDVRHNDGGVTVRCDWRQVALNADGGTVVFPDGITGVWDTYSHAPCRDGGVSCNDGFFTRDAGVVPGTSNEYTYALYPTSCDGLTGYVDAGE